MKLRHFSCKQNIFETKIYDFVEKQFCDPATLILLSCRLPSPRPTNGVGAFWAAVAPVSPHRVSPQPVSPHPVSPHPPSGEGRGKILGRRWGVYKRCRQIWLASSAPVISTPSRTLGKQAQRAGEREGVGSRPTFNDERVLLICSVTTYSPLSPLTTTPPPCDRVEVVSDHPALLILASGLQVAVSSLEVGWQPDLSLVSLVAAFPKLWVSIHRLFFSAVRFVIEVVGCGGWEIWL